MLNQILFYDFKFIQLPGFSLRINALLCLVSLVVCLLLKKRYPKLDILSKVIYIILILSLTNTLNFKPDNTSDINLDPITKILLFIKLLFTNPINSFMLPFFVYSFIRFIIFTPFSYFFKQKYLIFIFVIIIELFEQGMLLLNIGRESFSIYDIELTLLGYWIGYLCIDLYRIYLKPKLSKV